MALVGDDGIRAGGGWAWGCSHSMAQLVKFHPTAGGFLPVCVSDDLPTPGVLANASDSQVIWAAGGNGGGLVSAQLGALVPTDTGWWIAYNAVDGPGCCEAEGTALQRLDFDGNLDGDLTWVVPAGEGGDPANHRHPVMARLGTDADPEVYVVGYEQPLWSNYRMMLYDGSGTRISTYQAMYSAYGVYWGDRTDSMRTHVDGDVTWLAMGQDSDQLRLFRMTWATP